MENQLSGDERYLARQLFLGQRSESCLGGVHRELHQRRAFLVSWILTDSMLDLKIEKERLV